MQAKLFIDKNYAGNIDLGEISGEACFSKFHFTRLFRKIYGKTPHQYLRSVRVDKAMQLLRQATPVTTTCYLVGFESLSSFSGLFKSVVGMSPSAYLLRQRSISTQILKTPLSFVPGCFAAKSGWVKKSNFEEAPV